MAHFLAEIASYGFWMVVLLLFFSRMGLLMLKLHGDDRITTRWAVWFNRYTEFLRP